MTLLNSEDAGTMAVSHRGRSTRGGPHDLRTPGLLGQYPLIGVLMVLIGGGAFGVIATTLLAGGPVIQLDYQIANSLHELALHGSSLVRNVMIGGFYVGEHAIFAIGGILIVYFLSKRYWAELSMVVIAWGGELVILYFLSAYFHRPRPIFPVSAWRDMPSPGFPSGHSISSVLCYGLLAYLIIPHVASRSGKITVGVIAVLIMLFVGFSRLYVGDHYPTDILAGYSIGIFWAGLVYTSVELLAGRKPAQSDVPARVERHDHS